MADIQALRDRLDKAVKLLKARGLDADWDRVSKLRAQLRQAERSVPLADKVKSVQVGTIDRKPGVKYRPKKGPEVSHSLPLMPDSGYSVRSEGGTKIREYADGSRADLRGRRILSSEKDVSLLRKAGYTRSDD